MLSCRLGADLRAVGVSTHGGAELGFILEVTEVEEIQGLFWSKPFLSLILSFIFHPNPETQVLPIMITGI